MVYSSRYKAEATHSPSLISFTTFHEQMEGDNVGNVWYSVLDVIRRQEEHDIISIFGAAKRNVELTLSEIIRTQINTYSRKRFSLTFCYG